MRKKTIQPKTTVQSTNKTDKVHAWQGVQLGIRPFLIDDIFRQPTKEWLDTTTIEYIPFQTFDLWQLDRIQAITTNSPTTSAIIQQKVNYTIGDGFFVVPAASMSMLSSLKKQSFDKNQFNLEAEQQLNDFLTNVNVENENIEGFTAKVINDFCSFGNAFIELTKIKVGKTLKYNMRLLPIMWCRPKKAAENQIYPTHIGISSEFEQHYWTTPKQPYELPLFPVFEKIDGVEKSVVHLKNYEPTLTYWGVPDWISAKIWAELEYRIPKFNQSKFENGFTPSAIISLYGSTNQEEAQELVRAMKDCFTGTGNNNKMFIQALRDNSYKSDVQILNNNYDGEFMQLQNMAQTSIISAHRWTHSLTGLRTAGSLGTNQQIRSEFDIVYNTVIRPLQRFYLTKFLNPVIQDAAAFFGYDWSYMAVDIAKPMPVSFAGDLDIKTVLTQDEQRAELGFAPLQDVQVVQAKVKNELDKDTFNDYPKAARENAKRALKYREETNNKNNCGTAVGWARANQLAKGESISLETVKRMAAFIRHQQNKNVPYDEGCGGLMWDAWGGDEGINWAIRKIEQIENADTN